ncbi:hypothetical protein [uncultured Microscilla sp.]|uniref:hypothetical protein n=1 Tax=uncultured Microscilla sp. TaxID=432653 RepID=UPI00260FAAAE|nr:hypothetical protein [uncultured Microscilla sp.]
MIYRGGDEGQNVWRWGLWNAMEQSPTLRGAGGFCPDCWARGLRGEAAAMRDAFVCQELPS